MEQKEQEQHQLKDVINYVDYFLFTMCQFVILCGLYHSNWKDTGLIQQITHCIHGCITTFIITMVFYNNFLIALP